jgi:hypothetical protein
LEASAREARLWAHLARWLFSLASDMIAALLIRMKSATLLVSLSLLLCLCAPHISGGSDISKKSPSAPAPFSAEDFDWREMLPYLFVAATLPDEQGIKAVLEHTKVLRAYISTEIRAECRPDRNPCPTTADLLEQEVTKKIDQIVQEGMFHRHKAAIIDYPMARQSFAFSELAAVKSEKHPDAYLILQLADHSYKAWQVQAKYGAPYDTDILQWYSVYKYKQDNGQYTSKAVFEIDPTDGAVLRVAISLKPKKTKSH